MITNNPTNIDGCSVVHVDRHMDHRGFFQELYSRKNYGLVPQQVNWSRSDKNVLRGIHVASYEKLITCVSGSIFDVVVDLRKDSETYLKWYGTLLDSEHPSQMYIPKGCGHAFLALDMFTLVVYLQSEVYTKHMERSVRWNDPTINIMWPILNPILSEKDATADYINTKSAN